MPDKSAMNDPQNVWQNQPTEAFKMSVDQLRINAHKLERKSQFTELRSIVACAVVIFFFARFLLNPRPGLAPIQWTAASLDAIRLGCALICIGAAYEVYKAWKRMRTWRFESGATLETTIRSYRTLLERRRNFFRRMWHNKALWFMLTGMVFAGVPILINESHRSPQFLLAAAPLAGLLAIWWIAVVVIQRCSQRKLQQEIDQLRAFEREYRA